MPLTLEQARTIAKEAFAHGKEQAFAPLTIAVLDVGGHILLLERDERSGILRPDIAIAKAWGALGFGAPSRNFADIAEARPTFFATIQNLAGGRLVPAAGGCLIRDEDDVVLGAVGITGDNSDNDERCAISGIEAAGLRTDVPA
jgi:uncharacterized protein GlcG (DUF336 family)